jgi:hypothetical protein
MGFARWPLATSAVLQTMSLCIQLKDLGQGLCEPGFRSGVLLSAAVESTVIYKDSMRFRFVKDRSGLI